MAEELKLSDLYAFDETTGTFNPEASYADFENIVKNGTCEALGVSADVNMSTPMGRMLEWLALYFHGVRDLNIQNANQLLISAAVGQQLDAIAQWFQLARRPHSYSRVSVVCYASEDSATRINIGNTVRSQNGDVFEAVETANIGAGESQSVLFEALEPGAVKVEPNTINIIDSPQEGWASCNNPEKGVVGGDTETDESLRERIMEARAVAPGFLQAIKNAIEKVMPVGSAMVLENNTGAHLDVHGVDMEPHSILVSVDGLPAPDPNNSYSADSLVYQVAMAIFNTKPCGTGYTKPQSITTFTAPDGNEVNVEPQDYQYAVPVKDPFGNEYYVFFCRPVELDINVFIQIQKRTYTGSDLLGDATKAIQDWAATQNFKSGESIYSSDIIRAVESRVAGAVVVDCKISDGGIEKGTAMLEIDALHKAKLGTVYAIPYVR